MEKKFDAVQFQRKIREKLSQQYILNREKFIKEIKEHYPSTDKKNEKGSLLTRR